MQVCKTLINVFVETDMADMEGLRKQIVICCAGMIVRYVEVLMLIQCMLYPNAHATYLEILKKLDVHVQ